MIVRGLAHLHAQVPARPFAPAVAKAFCFQARARQGLMGSRGTYANNNDAHHQERPHYLHWPECFRALKSGAVPISHAPLLLRLRHADILGSIFRQTKVTVPAVAIALKLAATFTNGVSGQLHSRPRLYDRPRLL